MSGTAARYNFLRFTSMKKLVFFLFAMIFISLPGFSQTKKIAHKSHSGSTGSFSLSGMDNFGIIHKQPRSREKKDSTKKIKKDTLHKTPVKLPVKPKVKKVDPAHTRRKK